MSNRFIAFGENLRVVPTLHYRIAFSLLVSRGLAEDGWVPDTIAVELPPSLREPICEGLAMTEPGPLWVGKRVKEKLERFPFNDLTGYQHTLEASQATARILLDARRFALPRLKAPPNCHPDEWLNRHDAGFEPLVIVCDDTIREPRRHRNIVLPERIYQASEAYGLEPNSQNRVRTTRLAGRLWFTPPFYAGDRVRANWIKNGRQDRVPKAKDLMGRDGSGDWKRRLLSLALKYCRSHVIYIAPSDVPPMDDLLRQASEVGRQIVHVPVEEVDQAAFEIVARDEAENAYHDPRDAADPVVEAFSLHSGDAFAAALRFALKNDIEISWVDLELTDPFELALADARPPVRQSTSGPRFLEDAVLAEEGLQSVFGRIRQGCEATRIESIDGRRERQMAAHLRKLVQADRQVLFVCGAAHWGPIRKLLRDPLFDEEPGDIDCEPGMLFCSGPYRWSAGGAEVPLVAYLYNLICREGRESEFSLLQAGEVLRERIRRRLHENSRVSTGDILAFEAFVSRYCRQTGVILPRLDHLVAAVNSFFDERTRRLVFGEIMRFWRSCPKGIPKLSKLQFGRKGLAAQMDGKTYVIRSRWGGASLIYDAKKGQFEERVTDSRNSAQNPQDYAYTSEEWELHFRKMMLRARHFAAPKIPGMDSIPLVAQQYGPIDVRRTIRARTQGDRRAYQRVDTRRSLTSCNEFEGFDPVVWLFEEDVSASLEPMWLDSKRDLPGVIASRCHTMSGGARRYDFQLFAAWIPRTADSDCVLRKRIRRWLDQEGGIFVPPVDSLNGTHGESASVDSSVSDRILMLALDYCREYVICVSAARPSPHLKRAFWKKRKRLYHVPIDWFDKRSLLELRSPVYYSGGPP